MHLIAFIELKQKQFKRRDQSKMKTYIIKYENGKTIITQAENKLAIIKKYDLCNKENGKTIIIEKDDIK